VNSRKLFLTERALEDIERRAVYLTTERGIEFAVLWSEALIDWLEKIAFQGTFGYKRQATILADFHENELRIVRIYFAGQDWSR